MKFFDDFTQFLHLIELWLLIIIVIIDDNNADAGWYCGKKEQWRSEFYYLIWKVLEEDFWDELKKLKVFDKITFSTDASWPENGT